MLVNDSTPQRVLAMIPGHPHELGQDLSPLRPSGGPLIPFSNHVRQLSSCRHAQLPRHLLHHPAAPLPGSSLREATGLDSVTKFVSQCAGRFNCRITQARVARRYEKNGNGLVEVEVHVVAEYGLGAKARVTGRLPRRSAS